MPWDHNHFENWYISLATLRYQAIQHDKFTGQKLHGRRSHQTIMYGIWWWCVNFMMTNNYCHLFKFSDIIEQSQQTLLFYMSLSNQQMQHLKKIMRKFKDVTADAQLMNGSFFCAFRQKHWTSNVWLPFAWVFGECIEAFVVEFRFELIWWRCRCSHGWLIACCCCVCVCVCV